jgi:hypothetical protein
VNIDMSGEIVTFLYLYLQYQEIKRLLDLEVEGSFRQAETAFPGTEQTARAHVKVGP